MSGNTDPITPEENEAARRNWARMDADMREFVSALVSAGMVEGRRGLALAEVAVAPERLPSGDGVRPCVPMTVEHAAAKRGKGRA
ncbi:MAG: hypothetical protein REI09_11100 [Candidatus Dactylopiibacterium sp.]|nr:hypothetical protein [Candidatus Dactylopiibacterium sp.]